MSQKCCQLIVLAEEINQQNKCNSMSDAKRICLDPCTLECGHILETERHSATEFVSKTGGFKEGRHFQPVWWNTLWNWRQKVFFWAKSTVLWFEEKWSSEAIDGMFYLSINQPFAWSMSFTPWRNDNTQDLAEVEQMFTCSSLM